MFERLSLLKRLQVALVVAFVTFVIVLGVLMLRTAEGKDPSLGPRAVRRCASRRARRTTALQRRVLRQRLDEQPEQLVRGPDDDLAVMIDDRRLRLMGTDVRIVASRAAAAEVEALLRDYDARLSRFRADSELSALNADNRETVPASALLRQAVQVALDAAQASGGLVDPTLLDRVEAAGYDRSWDPARRVRWSEARAGLPDARPAGPDPDARWCSVRVDNRRTTISRPPGVRLDTGGTGKGHAADLAARAAYEPFWAVSCGGDLRVGGTEGRVHDVRVAHPLDGGALSVLRMRSGAVATSGIGARIWRRDDGRIAHHVIDPATGEPAYSGPRRGHGAGTVRGTRGDDRQGGAVVRRRVCARAARAARRRDRRRRRTRGDDRRHRQRAGRAAARGGAKLERGRAR